MSEHIIESGSASIVCDPQAVAPIVLMPGDPLRARYIAEKYLENVVQFNDVRNMLGFTGVYKGARISVMGSGMGMPSMCLYAHELFTQFDVETIIRVGTAGGLAHKVAVRDILVVQSAVTDSGIGRAFGIAQDAHLYATVEICESLACICERESYSHHVGEVFTSDFFYDPRPEINNHYIEQGYLAVDMESAGLFIEAQACGKRAGSILSCANHLVTEEALTAQEREQTFDAMIHAALECAAEL